MLDPVCLASFVAVADMLNFTDAAAQLNVRQSTVSGHIRKLEAACERRLFLRDTHSVQITADGEALLGFARSILESHDRALQHFLRNELHGRIRLGISEDIVLSELPRTLRAFTQAHPRVELELNVAVSEILRAKLDTGKLDLALLKRRAGDTYGQFVWSDPLVWAAAPSFHLDLDRPLPLILLEPPALTRTIALEALETKGCSWHIVCSSDSQSGVHAAVLSGLGIAPHAQSLLPQGTVAIRSKNLPSLGKTEFVILRRKGARDEASQALASLLTNARSVKPGREPVISPAI